MNRDDAPGMPERRHLSIRLLTLILLVSSAVTVLLAAWQLWADYDRDIDGIEERLTILEHTTLDPLSNSIWALNEEQIHLLLSGMLNLESVVGVELDTDQGRHYFFGAIPTENVGVVRRYPLVYRGQQQGGPAYALGTLTLHTSLDAVYERLFDRTANILVGQALKTFVVSAFILLIVQQLITRHLGRIADYARQLSTQTLHTPLRLERRRESNQPPDELDEVETALNYMRETMLSDIAGREAAEKRLQASEARYRQLFRSSSDGLCVLDPDGHLLQANPAFLTMLGYPAGELPDLTLTSMTTAPWHDTDAAQHRQALQSGQSDEYRKDLLQRDGKPLPVSVRLWMVGDPGTARLLMLRARDISKDLRLEEERQRLERHRNDMQRLETVGTLAGGIAHEFNNLLTPIKGYAELIARESEGSSITRAEAIAHAAERGRKLVEKILLLGRSSSTQRVESNVATIVRETLELANLSRPPNIRTTLHVRTPSTMAMVDPAQIHQAVMNLLTNAFAAMPSGGAVDVTVESAGKGGIPGLQIVVSDQGTGISPDVLPRIFEPFYSTHGPAQNSGLGLSMIRGIVSAHDGDITVESGSTGSVFRIWLPHSVKHSGEIDGSK